MTETPQLSGKDLARQALAAYKTTARTAPTTPAKPRRKRPARRGDGRDPVSLATALTGLGADLPLEAGIAGGNLLDQWPELCPHLVGRVEPAGYDEHTGRLDLRPASHAYAAQLRMLGGQLAKQINDKTGSTTVRSIRVLAVGNLTTTAPVPEVSERAEPEGPVKTRETASAGYRQALALVLKHRREPAPGNPYLAEAEERQVQALRANRQPETSHRDAVWADDQPTGPQPGSMDASIAAALAYKRSDHSDGDPRQVFGAA